MKSFTTLAILAAVLLVAAVAAARTRLPSRVELRQIIQRDTIRDAVRDGRLSDGMAETLYADQDTVEQRIRRFRADGYFNERELEVVDFLQDAVSRRIDRAIARDDTPVPERTAQTTSRRRSRRGGRR